MKISHCLECDRDHQVENWVPNPFICEACCGPWNPASSSESDGKRGIRFHGPDWVYGIGRGWTQAKQDALDATDRVLSERRAVKFWADFHSRQFEVLMAAFAEAK